MTVLWAFGWEVHKLNGPEDILNLKITIQSGKGVDSVSKLTPKYNINNAVLFQIRMDTGLACSSPCIFSPLSTSYLTYDTYTLFCNFKKDEGSDKTYMADVSLKTKTNSTKKTFHINDSTWRLLIEPTTLNFAASFELTVTLRLFDQILRPFALLYEDLKSTDLRLIGKDGTIEVHSAVLIAYSPVFNRELCEKAQESSRPYELILPHVKQSTLQHLKDYIYLNNVPDSPLSNVTDLINFATEYKMKELSQLCTQKLVTIAVAENFYELTCFALNNDMNEVFFDILELIENGKIRTEDIQNCSKIDSLSNGL
ncbi:PREDICTED: uncharacterized protein LOC106101394 isoform X2 [Papilio polytes]|uniref:uncharacterized protein LOC106101394 isoform X2 n=1 Tax=Papilio polytes TaxID=76194 RepID=UPI00067682B2|nr:PREDICTED: uncharacterized protein LOC106101394 isoform X2 [Papilio polytes]